MLVMNSICQHAHVKFYYISMLMSIKLVRVNREGKPGFASDSFTARLHIRYSQGSSGGEVGQSRDSTNMESVGQLDDGVMLE